MIFSKDEIENLISNQVQENKVLEYKQSLPQTEDQKIDFLREVTAFANTDGGNIIFGIEEKRDESGQPTGLPKKVCGLPGTNTDTERKILNSLIRDCTEPKLSGLNVYAVDGYDSNPVMVIQVPKSWSAPHMIKKGSSKFYRRISSGKTPMDITEIRTAFLTSGFLAEKVREFRLERVRNISEGLTPIKMEAAAPKIIMHVIPRDAFAPGILINPEIALSDLEFSTIGSSTRSYRHNIDGLLINANTGEDICKDYVQIFRNGIIEAVSSRDFGEIPETDTRYVKIIYISNLEENLVNMSKHCLMFEEKSEMNPPLFIFLTLINVIDYHVPEKSRWGGLIKVGIDRNEVYIPEIVIDSFTVDHWKVLKPIFDAIWQSGGLPRSKRYDENGNAKEQY